MAASLVLWAVTLGVSPQQALDLALEAVEPPPALRAAFRATLVSDKAVRRIEFDPYAAKDQQFRVTMRQGTDEELDAVVDGWRAEGQADVRLFADDLRQSLGDARLIGQGGTIAVEFRHQISPNDGAVDALISSQMRGQLTFDDVDGFLSRIDYAIAQPVKLDDGTTLKDYRQSYRFDHSERWGVTYVVAYELSVRGGRWGLEESRRFRVTLTDVAFGLAGDARQQLETRPLPLSQSTASLRWDDQGR